MKNGFSVSEQENQSKFFHSKLLHRLCFWHNFSLTIYCSTIIKAACMTDPVFSRVMWQSQAEWVWPLEEVVLKNGLELLIAVTEYQLRLRVLSHSSDFWSTCCGQWKDLWDLYKLFFSHICADTPLNIPNGIFRRIGGWKRAVTAAGYHVNDRRLGGMG